MSVLQKPNGSAENCAYPGGSPATSAPGLLVADASLKPVYANQEAIRILTFPQMQTRLKSLNGEFGDKISLLRTQGSSPTPGSVVRSVQIRSGRRIYNLRMFQLDGNGNGRGAAEILVMLERGAPESDAESHVAQMFHLTPREKEALVFLLEGLRNKEIAERMIISLSTVKAFIHSVMIKLGVSSRSQIAAKVLGLVLSSSRGSAPD